MNHHSLQVLEFQRIRDCLAERATSAGGVRLARSVLPGTDVEEITRRLESAAEIRRVLAEGDFPIHGVPDLADALERAVPEGAVLAGSDIAPIAKMLHIVRRLVVFLHERREALPRLAGHARSLDQVGSLREEIDRCLEPTGELRESASPTLRGIRREQERVRERILERLNRSVRAFAASGAEPTVTLRGDRHVLGVLRDRVKGVRGVIHGQSGSGASVYLEPEAVVPLNNELAELRSEEEAEILRILSELSAQVREHLEALRTNEACLAELDLFYAAGRLSRDLDAVPALPAQDGGVVIRGARHPLLLMANERAGKSTVPLDLRLGGDVEPVLVITGPNTGGKTVALKTVGLLALMNQAGLHVPAAEGTALPLFREVHADIGDEQSIEASLSTFSSHMRHVVGVLHDSDERTLVLLDELGVGTDPEEGAALGKAVLRRLASIGARTIVTTHYGALKAFAHETPGLGNASLEFDRESLRPTYRFVQGLPGASEGLAIARRLGFPAELIDEARGMVGSEKEAVESLLHDLQAKRNEAIRERGDLERERRETAELREKVEQRLEGLGEERRRLRREASEEARRLVEQAKAELAQILDAVRVDSGAGKAVGRARTRLGEMGKEFDRGLEREGLSGEPSRPARPEEIDDGTPVAIPALGWRGTALGKPGDDGRVMVAVGSFRVELPVSALEIRREVTAAKRSAHPALVAGPTGTESLEIDLRGCTVEEALAQVDQTLDGLIVSGGSWIRIIHGKGTGALRTAITEQLRNDSRVKSFRLGEPGEGGSGVTVVLLR